MPLLEVCGRVRNAPRGHVNAADHLVNGTFSTRTPDNRRSVFLEDKNGLGSRGRVIDILCVWRVEQLVAGVITRPQEVRRLLVRTAGDPELGGGVAGCQPQPDWREGREAEYCGRRRSVVGASGLGGPVPRSRGAFVLVAVLAVVVLCGVVIIVGGMTGSGHPASAVGEQSPAGVPVSSPGVAAAGTSGGQAGGAALCNSQRLAVDGGVYTVQNNEWGSGAPECLAVGGSGGFTVTRFSYREFRERRPGAATRPSTGAVTGVPVRRTVACRCRSPGCCHREP